MKNDRSEREEEGGREGANEREQRLFVNSDKNSDRLMTHPSDSESETAVAAALTGNCFARARARGRRRNALPATVSVINGSGGCKTAQEAKKGGKDSKEGSSDDDRT